MMTFKSPGLWLSMLLMCTGLSFGCAPGVQTIKAEIKDPGQMMFNAFSDPNVGCYKCHNGDAKGTKWGPNLAKRIAGQADEDLKETILAGNGGMPSFKGKLNDQQISVIIGWLRTLKP